jgi:hypothetical protein
MKGLFGNRREDGEELVALVAERGKLCLWNDATVGEKFEPVGRLVQFLQAVADLGNEFGFGAGTLGFPIVCPHGRAGTQHLLAQHLCLFRLR